MTPVCPDTCLFVINWERPLSQRALKTSVTSLPTTRRPSESTTRVLQIRRLSGSFGIGLGRHPCWAKRRDSGLLSSADFGCRTFSNAPTSGTSKSPRIIRYKVWLRSIRKPALGPGSVVRFKFGQCNSLGAMKFWERRGRFQQ
jgi:hypothetical protein